MRKLVRGCAVSLGVLALPAAVAYFVLARVVLGGLEKHESCESHLKLIIMSALKYADDHGGQLPDAGQWRDQLLPDLKDRHIYICPDPDPATGALYAMNPHLSGRKVSEFPDPAKTVVLYDADLGGHPAPRHHGGTNCAFLDGHVGWVRGVPGGL